MSGRGGGGVWFGCDWLFSLFCFLYRYLVLGLTVGVLVLPACLFCVVLLSLVYTYTILANKLMQAFDVPWFHTLFH